MFFLNPDFSGAAAWQSPTPLGASLPDVYDRKVISFKEYGDKKLQVQMETRYSSTQHCNFGILS